MANENILIAEDDAGLRVLTTRILLRAGYNVYSASQHDEAEAIANEHGSSIHLLLTDVVMPEVSGKELADRLTAKYPNMAVLFMSGYTDETVLKLGVSEGTMHFIAKPFTPASLVEKVREVLDAWGRAVNHREHRGTPREQRGNPGRCYVAGFSAVPAGLCFEVARDPALTCRAIVSRPAG